mmetsp:Transcript_98267/g.277886  ORF Transcript_98267/g.277886 Transcript_98267/m.277886 type:complete len:228 (-) Transcript_98267:37-720(-)
MSTAVMAVCSFEAMVRATWCALSTTPIPTGATAPAACTASRNLVLRARSAFTAMSSARNASSSASCVEEPVAVPSPPVPPSSSASFEAFLLLDEAQRLSTRPSLSATARPASSQAHSKRYTASAPSSERTPSATLSSAAKSNSTSCAFSHASRLYNSPSDRISKTVSSSMSLPASETMLGVAVVLPHADSCSSCMIPCVLAQRTTKCGLRSYGSKENIARNRNRGPS